MDSMLELVFELAELLLKECLGGRLPSDCTLRFHQLGVELIHSGLFDARQPFDSRERVADACLYIAAGIHAVLSDLEISPSGLYQILRLRGARPQLADFLVQRLDERR